MSLIASRTFIIFKSKLVSNFNCAKQISNSVIRRIPILCEICLRH
jgi:hypothetical protein